MFMKSLSAMAVAMSLVVGMNGTAYAFTPTEDDIARGNVKADGWFAEELAMENRSWVGSEADFGDISEYFTTHRYLSPSEHIVGNFKEPEEVWLYATVSLAEDYGDIGYEIWLKQVDPIYPGDPEHWSISEGNPFNGEGGVKAGDTVLVFGNVQTIEDWVRSDLYITNPIVLTTDRSFEDVYTQYANWIVQ